MWMPWGYQAVSSCQPFQYSNAGLKTGLKKACYGPKCTVFKWSTKSRDFIIWILDTHTVRYSDESNFKVFGIQIVIVQYERVPTGLVFVLRLNTTLGFQYRASNRLRLQTFKTGLENESRVGTPICQNLVCWSLLFWKSSHDYNQSSFNFRVSAVGGKQEVPPRAKSRVRIPGSGSSPTEERWCHSTQSKVSNA